jgi:hypothetical protein
MASSWICAASAGKPQPVRTPCGTLQGSTIGEATSDGEPVDGTSQAGSASTAAISGTSRPAGTFSDAFESAPVLTDPLAQAGGEGGRLGSDGGSAGRRATRDVCGSPMEEKNADKTISARTARARQRAEDISSSPARICDAPQTVLSGSLPGGRWEKRRNNGGPVIRTTERDEGRTRSSPQTFLEHSSNVSQAENEGVSVANAGERNFLIGETCKVTSLNLETRARQTDSNGCEDPLISSMKTMTGEPRLSTALLMVLRLQSGSLCF